MNKNIKILAIESSCDETSAAVISGENFPQIDKNIVASQIDIHKLTNGVVPEVAARAHSEQIIPVIKEALGGKIADKIKDIDLIAVTQGPGLIGSLLIGLETAKTLAMANNKPIIAVNHLEGHIYAALTQEKDITFPVLILIVSGGNTQLVLM
jgi:N6-L-threonylcarbamoyladenine synthase